MKVLTTAGLTKLIQLCKNAIPTVPVTDVTVGGTSVVSSGVAVVPAIPTVNNPTITITQGGVTKGSFTLNQSSDGTIALDAGGVTAFQAPTAQNNYTWYRKYADGWVEQGGQANGNKTVSLPISMSDANYETIINTIYNNSGATAYNELGYVSKTTTSFTKSGNANIFNWLVYGMAA